MMDDYVIVEESDVFYCQKFCLVVPLYFDIFARSHCKGECADKQITHGFVHSGDGNFDEFPQY
jgi:hypothetical protein